MSHVTGTVQILGAPITIGPDSGAPASSPNTWTHNFAHVPAPSGTKFVILHFRNASLPANNRLEVDLGYDTDVFTSADGTDFWTRPVNIHVLAGGLVPIRYITDGAAGGGVQLDKYGRGERHAGEQDPMALSNCDPFLPGASYTEPLYDPFWFCGAAPNWENIMCVPDASDVRRRVARSVGMIVTIHGNHVSSCSVTLIGTDLIITAGHCLASPAEEVPTSSVTFDYQVNCNGTRPAGYNARFFKVKKLIKWRNSTVNGSYHDYCMLQLKVPPGGTGVPHLPMRTGLPGLGEQIFGVHHPNGAVKKLSIPHPGFATVLESNSSRVRVNLDVSGGSSGSGLFDSMGNIVGVLSTGVGCSLNYFPTATILQDIETPTGPPITRDVMIIFDRSGSMSMSAGTGRTKIVEARDAASLFIQLVRAATGNRVGLVSFSTSASSPVDFALANVTAANKTALIGPAPFTGGIVGALAPGGNTTIGGGLEAARLQFPAPGANPRTMLLLTDGLQNTPPMIETVAPTLSNIDVNAIGFGTESSLNGALLTHLAQTHNGLYSRAGDGLHLKKFFALAFGNIFEAGALADPEFFLPKSETKAPPFRFDVCGEETITVVVGWDREDAELSVQLKTPGGAFVFTGSTGVEHSSGRTWMFMRVTLPFNGERDGVWEAQVFRPGGGEFPPPAVDLRYFINVLASGGPSLTRMPESRRYYTGDAINPLVALKYSDGSHPHGASVRVTVTKPDGSVGNILTRARLGPPSTLDSDTIPARQATLLALEGASGSPVVNYIDSSFELFDDPLHGNNSFEPNGVFGNLLRDLLVVEGNYTFHFRATYGEGCVATRELIWSLHVEPGVDPTRTDITVNVVGTRPNGTRDVIVVFVPRDKYGNHVGPGRGDILEVTGVPGTVLTAPVHDNGDGSYTAPGTWDPASGQEPGVIVAQPDRPCVVVQPPTTTSKEDCSKWRLLFWLLLILLLFLLLLLILLLINWT